MTTIASLTSKAQPVYTDELEIQETGGGTSYKITINDLLSADDGATEPNFYLGAGAGDAITTAEGCTLVGYNAGKAITTSAASGATCIGSLAGEKATTAAELTAIGYNAASEVTTATGVCAIGYAAANNYTGTNGGDYCTHIGNRSGGNVGSGGTGTLNTCIGYETLRSVTSGSENTVIGGRAGYSLTSGSFNTFVGGLSGYQTTTASYNTFLGYQCGYTVATTGQYNVAAGYQAFYCASGTGDYNVALGYRALYTNPGDGNIAIGYEALRDNTGDYNVAIGDQACEASAATSYVVAIGAFTLMDSGGSDGAVAVGGYAGKALGSEATGFTAVGQYAGTANIYAANVTLCGDRAGQSLVGATAATTDDNTTACGYNAAYYLNGSTGQNTFLGSQSGLGVNGSTSGADNCAAGYQSLYAFTTGYSNCAMGSQSLLSVSTGYENIGIGYQAGSVTTLLTTGNNNILIGTGAITSAATSAGQYVIGDGCVGSADTRVHIGNATNHIYADYNSAATWTYTSDARLKNFVGDSKLGLDFINALNPVCYHWKPNNEWPEELQPKDPDAPDMDTESLLHGLKAQEVKAAMELCGVDEFQGWKEVENGKQTISETALVFPLINAVKELSARVEALKNG